MSNRRRSGNLWLEDAIEVETRTTIRVVRSDVAGWTDEEWQQAVEAARDFDTDHEAWDTLPADGALIEHYEVEDVTLIEVPVQEEASA